MKILTFTSQEDWLLARQGKITGTRLKDIVVKRGTGKKIGFYELIAERLTVSEEDFDGYVPNETPIDRGTRLQGKALDMLEHEIGKKIDRSLVLWTRDDNESIAISPDGTITESAAAETKCLSSAKHVEAYLTQQIPDEYEFQKLQYFIVNDKLQSLYFGFYDPRLPAIQFFFIRVLRFDIQAEIEEYLEYQRKTLKEVDEIVSKLSNF